MHVRIELCVRIRRRKCLANTGKTSCHNQNKASSLHIIQNTPEFYPPPPHPTLSNLIFIKYSFAQDGNKEKKKLVHELVYSFNFPIKMSYKNEREEERGLEAIQQQEQQPADTITVRRKQVGNMEDPTSLRNKIICALFHPSCQASSGPVTIYSIRFRRMLHGKRMFGNRTMGIFHLFLVGRGRRSIVEIVLRL